MTNYNFSDFCQMEVRRTKDIAEIIICNYEGNILKPIRLIGFQADASKSNFEIIEEAYEYWQLLVEECRK